MSIIKNVVIVFDGGNEVSLELSDNGFSSQYLHDNDIDMWRKYRSSRKWDYIKWTYGSEEYSIKVNRNKAYLCPSIDNTKLIISRLNDSKTCDIYDGKANKIFEIELPMFKSPNHPCTRKLPRATLFMEPGISNTPTGKVNSVWVSNSDFMLEEEHVIDTSNGVFTECIGTQRR